MKDKIIEKLLKLQQLAERGEENERENARQRIEEIMKKYGITDEDLTKDDCYFHFTTIYTNTPRFSMDLWRQVCACVLMTTEADVVVADDSPCGKKVKKILKQNGIPHNAAVKCTDAEFVQIIAKYEFYVKHLEYDEDVFYNAFLLKNNLMVTVSEKEYMDSTTQEQREKRTKARKMSLTMDEHIFHKQIDQCKK